MFALKKFLALPLRHKLLFFEALFWAVFFRFIIFALPFRFWRRYLGTPHTEADFCEISGTIINIVASVKRCSKYFIFNQNCLVDALITAQMLRKRKVRCTLYLGLQKKEKLNLAAHAWIKCGHHIIIGQKGHKNYTAIEWYA